MTDGTPGHRAEDRLCRALHGRAGGVQPDEAASLAAIEARVAAARQAGRRRRGGLALLAAAAVVVAVLGGAALLGDDGDRQVATTGRDPGPASPTTAPSTTTTAPAPAPALTVWPPESGPHFTDPVETVGSFVSGYLGRTDPPLSEFRPTGSGTGEVDVLLRGEDGEVRPDLVNATVAVVMVDDHWEVAGARSDDIVLDAPQPQAEIPSPLVVSGRGRGFEGNLVVRAVEAGKGRDRPLAEAVATAGCCEDLEPFRVELDLAPTTARQGSVVVVNDTGSFVVVPVKLGPAGSSALTAVQVGWVGPDGSIVTRPRAVPRSAGVLRGAIQQLLLGPTAAERDEGLRSALDLAAAEVGFSVVLRAGEASVDFGAGLPAASPGTSSSAGSEKFLAQLRATVFQFPTVARAEYTVGGSCEAFWAWLQRDCTLVVR